MSRRSRLNTNDDSSFVYRACLFFGFRKFGLLRDSWHELFVLTAAQYFSETDISLLHEEHRSNFGSFDIEDQTALLKDTLAAVKHRQVDPIEQYLLNEIILLKSGKNPFTFINTSVITHTVCLTQFIGIIFRSFQTSCVGFPFLGKLNLISQRTDINENGTKLIFIRYIVIIPTEYALFYFSKSKFYTKTVSPY